MARGQPDSGPMPLAAWRSLPRFVPLSYSAREPGIRPEAYDPEPDAGFTPLREQDLTAAGFGEAA